MTVTRIFLAALIAVSNAAIAQDQTVSCEEALSDLGLDVTAEARERYRDLQGSCEGIIEMNGKQYLTTTAVVRRASNDEVTLYIPATDHTFAVSPPDHTRIVIDGRKVRPRELDRGQEVHINIAVDAITEPHLDEVAMATETEGEYEPVRTTEFAALPTTG